MTLPQLLNLLFKKRKLIFLIICLTSIIGAIYSFFIPNSYKSTSLLSSNRMSSSNFESGNSGNLLSQFGIRSSSTDPELTFAQNYFYSYNFIAKFLVDNDLLPYFLAFKNYEQNSRKIIFDDGYESLLIKNLFANKPIDYGTKEVQDAVKEIRKHISLTMDVDGASSKLLTLTTTYFSPDFALYLNKSLSDALNKNIAMLDIEQSEGKLKYAQIILPDYQEAEVRSLISKMISKELSSLVLAKSSDSYSFMVLDPPVLPIKKYYPVRPMFLLTSIFSGLMIAISYILGEIFVRRIVAYLKREINYEN